VQEPLVGFVISADLEVDEEASLEERRTLTDAALDEGKPGA
jgi:hypothetical protein